MSQNLLCVLPTCRLPRRHGDDCPGDGCGGCQRARAADGLRLCALHTRRIGDDAQQCAELYDECELRLMGGAGTGDKVSGTSDTTRLPNPAAVEMRTEIRHVLASWCRLVAEERGFELPADDVRAMARYVRRSAEWLAATDYADEVASELADLRRRAWAVAYPNGTRVVEIAPCPQPLKREYVNGLGHNVVEVGPECCPGTVKAILRPADALLPSELVCSANPAHRWPAGQWHAFRRAVGRRAA